MNLKAYSTGVVIARSAPYAGRYPCGSLMQNGVWYYGTYCLGPSAQARYGDLTVNWPWMGPFVGFRHSSDRGRNWTRPPHTPGNPLFGENGINGYPVKIGVPHFVDFGKNMRHSPDGKAYLVAHGSDLNDKHWRFWNNSWINGDQIYLLRVTPRSKTSMMLPNTSFTPARMQGAGRSGRMISKPSSRCWSGTITWAVSPSATTPR